ncbi:DNA-directed RNA polymerase III subunit RPC4 [Cloeon dipterum]|uniref:DNA-directed RNA polymerase III subunit RPC4 n=1 Tax=Cloeon dipterum TaxID=197152 RepID=UPI0032207FE5
MAKPQAECSSSKQGMSLPSLSNGLLSSLGSRPSGRLESFRTPRDLTLGAVSSVVKQKRKFEPILPTKGKAKATPPKPVVASTSNDSGKNKEPPAKKPRKRPPPKERTTFIQTEGSVFGQGQAERQIKIKEHYHCSSSSSSKKTDIIRPIIKKEVEDQVRESYSENNEDIVITEMKRSDFLDNPKSKISWGDSKPFLIQQNRVPKMEIKPDPDGEGDNMPQKINVDPDKPSIASILTGNGEPFLIQLPDCLPGRVEMPSDSSQVSTTGTSKAKKSMPATLNDLPEGSIGYIEILQSGKARLKLGNHKMYMEMGAYSSIRQELVMVDVNTDEKRGNMCDLGQVNHRLICVPDWQSELAEAFNKSECDTH